MSKEMTVIVLGIWIIVVPYLGVPGSWRTALLVITGTGIAALGFFLRAEALSRGKRTQHHTFVENADTVEPHSSMHDHKERITSLN